MIDPWLAWLLVAGSVFAGSVVQSSVGFGIALVAAPVVMALMPDAMPAAMTMVAGLQPVLTLMREWRHVDLPGLGWSLLGRLPGALLGAWLVVAVPASALGAFVGITVVVMALLQWRTLRLPLNRTSRVLAGAVSGVTGTSTSIGGPPLAMVYADQPGPVVRGTLAAYFMVGSVLSVVLLGAAGRVGVQHVQLAASLVPALVLGTLAARPVSRWLDAGRMRRAVLVVALVAGCALALTSLT